MKKLGLLLTFLLVTSSFYAQKNQDVPLNLRSLSLDDKSWFREVGFPITKYNFTNNEINQELSLGLDERKKAKTLSTIAWGAFGAGILANIIGATNTEGGPGLNIAGGVMMVGGLSLSLFTSSKKKKALKRIQNAAYLYDDLN